MATFKETVLRMVARKELSAAQAMTLIAQAGAVRPAQPVAIIGMSGRFPGAGDTETYWRNLRDGVFSVGEIPASRWSLDGFFDQASDTAGSSYCKWGGFVDGIDEFDAAFFNISAKEAQLIDPQQRLFLEEASRALEDAGLTAAQLDGVRCGVFAGVAGGDFIHRIADEGIAADAYAFMGNASSILAARISYHLNLKGPSIAIDTACSSSLVALHLACESLTLGTSELALVGGVCVLNTPNFFMAGAKAGMLSRTGTCRTFDQSADGFVPAEGVGVIVLKCLDRALADGDHILGVIEGSAINQDGRTNGITAPSAPSQTALALDVYGKFGIDPSGIGYVEAHGTGTPLGDPIEIQALSAAFRQYTTVNGFCAIGSSKTNIGHAMSASGMAGVIKVLKALEAGQRPPSLHFEHENPAIGFAATPFRVNTALEDWPAPAGAPRRAAISSFGFSGTNAHLVIAEAPAVPAAPAIHAGVTLPFVVTARSRVALQANCKALADWLEQRQDARLDSVSWTLLTGRNHYEHRVVLQAPTAAALIVQLRAPIGDTSATIPDAGTVFAVPPPRIALPTYRFERVQHALGSATQPKHSIAPHPLLDHAGAGSLRSRWDASLPFARDHLVRGKHIVPGACLLELALAATRATALEAVIFHAPLVLGSAPADIDLLQGSDGAFQIRTGDGSDGSQAGMIASGRARQPGASIAPPDPPVAVPDLAAWRARPATDVDALLARFHAAGVVLGPYCRGLRRLWLDAEAGEALAQLQLPAGEARSLSYYALHPTLVDGAFQAAMALLSQTSGALLVPASIGHIRVHAALPAICYAHVRLTGTRSFDLVIADEQGTLLAVLRSFAVAELRSPPAPADTPAQRAAEPVLRYYRPEWLDAASPVPAAGLPQHEDGLTLLVRAPDAVAEAPLPAALLEVTLATASLSVAPGQWQIDARSPGDFAELMAGLKPLRRVVFLAGEADPERDLAGLLHLLQALPRTAVSVTSGVGTGVAANVSQPLSVIVCAPPQGAAVLGFAQTVSREETQWRFTVIESTRPGAAWQNETGDISEPAGTVLALREGRRLRRALSEYVFPADAPHRSGSAFRDGGVYLIAGGAGGIGLALARHLAAQHGARVLLLGRREMHLELPPAIRYRRTDITDLAALSAVVEQTRAEWGPIHGVIHAAMVLRDVGMRRMDTANLHAVLAPKLAGSAALAQVFASQALAGRTLDFMAFFSSANAFFGNAGQANYAAASVAQDALARHLATQAHFPVRIINWGYWGEVGAVATQQHRQRALEHGIGAISVAEGWQALEACLRGDQVQLMPMKVEPATLARMGLLAPSADDDIAAAFDVVESQGRAALRRFIGADGRLTLAVVPRYARLRDALEAMAAKPEAPTRALPASGTGWTAPFTALIERCLAHYPAVLAGELNPAEVLFPGGSTAWVAPLYRDNPIVDRYNSRAAQELMTRVATLLAQHQRVRIFEVGSGTGGTSRAILAALGALIASGVDAGKIEFVFSDLSAGLVRQAKAELGPQYPFARFVVHDVAQPPSSQGAQEQAYDLVLASNVLHATRNIAACLRNVHKLLRSGGALLLNESIRLHDFSTLTFGLTDGWWMYDDPAARLPHSPLLDEARWYHVLEECYASVEIMEGEAGAPQAVFVAVARPHATAHAADAMPVPIAASASIAATASTALHAAAPASLAQLVHRQLAAVLGVGVADVDPERRFSELGIDSISGADLVTRINASLSTQLIATVLYEYSTVHQLARHLAALAPEAKVAAAAPAAAPEATLAPVVAGAGQAIAVVGLAGRFPGAADAAAFWRDLRDGVSRTGEVPAERWDVNTYYDPEPGKPGKSPCKWGGFLDDIDKFDPAFFQMSGAEAEYTDPQQRLFIEQAWHAIEDAGYAPQWLDGRRCGVFVGAAAGDYIHRMDADDLRPQAFLGNGVSMLASRIAYLLNLRGPALSVDTACSSSLLAVHLACQSIRSGECDLALAGGVFVSTMPSFHYLTGRLGMLSPHGQCRAFDDGADGFVPGEAVAAVVLRPLDAALRDGDFIYGVIAASGANQDGHSNGITAPSAASQAELEAEVYARAGIDARSIGYVEAHGTGTRLGDPLEIEGLTRAFRRSTPDRQFCAIGSAKTNIGHAGPAAGIVGLVKVLLAMRHREIPPSLHFERANAVIDFAGSPFFVATERQPWPPAPMRAAVSAFGLSGTNVHLVVDEAPTALQRPAATGATAPLYPVSAMSEAALAEAVARLQAWLASDGRDYLPRDIAYTLGACRKHHAWRAVPGAAPGDPLAARYLAGETIDWLELYPPASHRRVPLPGYPFSRERYWIEPAATRVAQALPPSAPAPQPVHTYCRRWVAQAGTPVMPANAPSRVALIGGGEAQVARLSTLLGVPVSQDMSSASVIALLPGACDDLETYLDIARRAGRAQRVLVVHQPADHAAIASAALHHSLRFVHPQLLWQTLETSDDAVTAIAHELLVQVDAAQLRHDDGVRMVYQTVPLQLVQNAAPLRRGGVWWISGGAGKLGMQVARWLVERCDARVIITSRHPPRETPGPNIEFLAADVSDRSAMQAVRETIRSRHGALHGVVHAAGSIEAPLLSEKHDSRAVLAPKIDGVRLLDELTRDTQLDAFVIFSSLAALVGDFGQCDYACANRYLESYAQWRTGRRAGRTVAIHWPLWAEGGMRPARGDEHLFAGETGLQAIGSNAALRLLEQAIGADTPLVAVACGDAAHIEATLAARRQPYAIAPAASAAATASNPTDLEQLVLECTARVVRLPVSKLARDMRFSEVGLDSLYMKDLAAALAAELGIAVSPTAFFQHQTAAELAAQLYPAWSAAAPQPQAVPAATGTSAPAPAANGSPLHEPIAIIGISGRFPASDDVAGLWRHLIAGDDCITEVPAERWDWRAYAAAGGEHDRSASRWGGFMPGISHFDSAFFGISPRESVYMDPQHRLFLQGTWSALEDAGIRPSTLAGRQVGVWAGAQPNEYMQLIGDAGAAKAQAVLGNTQTMLANRVSYWFDLRGPSQTIDTACSSSLIAVHRAVRALQSGDCELAIAGGVSAILAPATYVLATQLGMLSPDGRCKTFDRSANGYVKGEGVGVAVLKPLARALADGDHVYGVIRATSEGHGGKASSLTAPNPQAQAALVADTWRRAGVPIDSVSYIEAHGTGTELGDPIEVEALGEAFRTLAREQGLTLREGACGLGSIKSNIGHLEPAAGIAGLFKVLLAMQHGALPATLHVSEVNPYLKLDGSPFHLVRERTGWQGNDGAPLRAGVSAFGFGGSYAHVALEQAPASPARQNPAGDGVLGNVPISAKTPAALRTAVVQLCGHLERTPVDWVDLVHTLQHGREQFEHGIRVSAASVPQLLARCRAWLDGAALEPADHGVPPADGRSIPLPTYPFEPRHVWFDRTPGAPNVPVAVPLAAAATSMAPVTQAMPTVPAPPVLPVVPAVPAVPTTLAATQCRQQVRAMLAELLYLEAGDIADDARFVDLGLDSILAVEFAKKLQEHFGLDLRATRLYDFASVAELGDHIGAVPVSDAGAPAVAAPAPAPAPAPVNEPAQGRALGEVRAMLAELLYLESGDIADEAPFVELGLDSILAVEFAKKLHERYAIDLRATRLYDYPNVLALASWIDTIAVAPQPAAMAGAEGGVAADAEVQAEAAPAALATDIAIVGMAGRFPGAADVQAYWRNLAAGVDSVVDVPPERWDVNALYPHRTYCRKGGFIDNVDQFDPLFFKISPQEAEWMDPQQRLFLEQAWLALEDAGMPDQTLSGMRCAVFAGAGQGDYFRLMDADGDAGAQFGIGNVGSILAARLAYFLNLKGAAVSLDTACSSSLVATHLAARALVNGECDLAVAGGVSLMLTPQMHVLTCQTRMLSPDGHCKAFDNGADGFVPGEAVGAVVLKRLADALADGDRIHAVIRASGTNQDGRTNGITAPSAQSQAALALSVYRSAGIDPSTITCVEAHGTGTRLGDPIEVDALTQAFRHYTEQTQYCAIGSVKTNIGHTLPAAGIAGLIKSVLMLKAGQIAPSLHCSEENEQIDFAATPFYVNTVLRDWQPPAGVPRRVAVSSFGFSGTNAHLVLEEWTPPPAARTPQDAAGPWSFVLSARSSSALRQRADELAAWLEGEGSQVALCDIAHTLAQRRSRHARVRIVNAASRPELSARLRLAGAPEDQLLAPRPGRVVSLPAYPFERRRYWVQHTAQHPLIDELQQSFAGAVARKQLAAHHPLLVQHVVAGTPTLPGAVHVEIALACGVRLAPPGSPAAVLRNVVWTRPFQPPQAMLETRFAADGGDIRHDSPYCRGTLTFAPAGQAPADVDLRLVGGDAFSGADVYAAFEGLGLSYGPALRGIMSLQRDAAGTRVIAQLTLPDDHALYLLDPRVLDAALQTPIGFALGRPADGPAMVPYRLERLERYAPLVPGCLAVATLRKGDTPTFDIRIVDPQGKVLVDIAGFSSLAPRQHAGAGDKHFLMPRWRVVPAPATPERERAAGSVLVLHAAENASLAEELIRQSSAGDGKAGMTVLLGTNWRAGAVHEDKAMPMEIDHRSPADWERLAASMPPPGRIVFLGGLSRQALLDGAMLETFQEGAALALARLVRAWALAERALPELTVVTNGVARVLEHDSLYPQAAALPALAAVIAKEYPGARIGHLDFEGGDLASNASQAALILSSAPGSIFYRGGLYYTQTQEALRLPEVPQPGTAFRQGGVYLIIGGGGGIGGALALRLAADHQARIALVGRRAADDAIAATLAAIAAAGGEAIYLRADVGNGGEVASARDAAVARWGAVHGVIHAALALRDQTLAYLDDTAFTDAIRTKGSGTSVLAHAFHDVPLDWMLIFSSTISFTRNAGQASYTAASALQDAVAAALARPARWPLKTINWGYWGEVGVVATERHRALAARQGVGSVTLDDAIDAIERLLACDLQQLAVIRLLSQPASTPQWQRNTQLANVVLPLAGAELSLQMMHQEGDLSNALARLESCALRVLAQRLGAVNPETVVPARRPLYQRARSLLEAAGRVESNAGADAVDDLSALAHDAEVGPLATRLAGVLRTLPDLLQGAAAPAAFGGGMLAPQQQHLLDHVLAAIAERPLMVIEAGAGTHAAALAWPDLGAAPVCSHLDLLRDPQSQGLLPGAYDVAIAANVLHGVHAIGPALQGIKRLLKRGGLLVLAEMTGACTLNDIAFGLDGDEGRYRDAARRQPHTPLMSVAQWSGALTEAGYGSVRILGAHAGFASELVIFVARSDGWYLEGDTGGQAGDDARAVATGEDSPSAPQPALHALAPATDVQTVRGAVAAILRMRDAELENDAPFEDYGVDSLVAIDIVQRLEAHYGNLPATLLHKYNSIDALAAYLAARHLAATSVDVQQQQSGQPAAAAPNALVTLHGSGTGPRTFWVHSVLGETDWVGRLQQRLPAAWPVYALRFPYHSLEARPFATLEEMAASYLAEIRAVQPYGPYILGGYSLGGSVAFEIGRQLIRAGERVQALILLDAFAPNSAALASLRSASWDGFLGNVVGALLERTRETPPSERELAALTDRLLAIAHQCAPLLDDYLPEPCAMNTILLRNRHSFIGPDSPIGLPAVSIDDSQPDHGWTAWLGAAPHILEIDTDHFCMGLEPAIGEVARRVAEFLEPSAESVFSAVRSHIHRVVPDIDRDSITMLSSLRELGANSLDRTEVAICTMEELQLRFAPTQLAGVQNIAELVDVFLSHLRARASGKTNGEPS